MMLANLIMWANAFKISSKAQVTFCHSTFMVNLVCMPFNYYNKIYHVLDLVLPAAHIEIILEIQTLSASFQHHK